MKLFKNMKAEYHIRYTYTSYILFSKEPAVASTKHKTKSLTKKKIQDAQSMAFNTTQFPAGLDNQLRQYQEKSISEVISLETIEKMIKK